MANPLKGEVELLVGDKSLILRFSVDAICSLEERLGKGFPAIAGDLQDPAKVTITLVRHLLHAGLSEFQPDITLKEAGELIVPAGGMVKVLEQVSKAITAAFPQQAEASGTRRPPKRLNGRTGVTS